MQANLMAHHDRHSGYGRMGYYLTRELEYLGVESVGDIGHHDTDVELAHLALWLSTPPHVKGWYEDQLAVIFTMWESTEIPPGFRENLHHFDRIIVPSVQNLELYRRFHPDVRYVPLGVDTDTWHYSRRPGVGREFRFLTAGYGPRKGVKQVVSAFKRVFPGGLPLDPLGPIPRLTVLSKDDVGGPGIERIAQTLSGAVEVAAYANAHCYVSGSKGEGWGLMPLQAIAQGLPTILGDAHGHHAFAHYGIPIDTHPYSAQGATFWGDGGDWWEPDFEQMCEAMREVYENYALYEREAIENANAVGAEFTWAKSAEALLLELPEINEPAPRRHVWRPAPARKFHIRVNKPCQYRVNGLLVIFEPGVDYYEAADLKRAVINGGYLDWSTFDPNDVGVEDNADLARLRLANSVCPTCHQPYDREQALADLLEGIV